MQLVPRLSNLHVMLGAEQGCKYRLPASDAGVGRVENCGCREWQGHLSRKWGSSNLQCCKEGSKSLSPRCANSDISSLWLRDTAQRV